MDFQTTWHALLDNVESLPADVTLVTPLSDTIFHTSDI